MIFEAEVFDRLKEGGFNDCIIIGIKVDQGKVKQIYATSTIKSESVSISALEKCLEMLIKDGFNSPGTI